MFSFAFVLNNVGWHVWQELNKSTTYGYTECDQLKGSNMNKNMTYTSNAFNGQDKTSFTIQ